MPKRSTLLILVLCAFACSQSSTDPSDVGGALHKVQPVVKPPVVAPPVVAPTQIDRAFDVEESQATKNLDRAFDVEETKPADLQSSKVAPTTSLPSATPGPKPLNPTVKPLSPPPTGG